MKKNYELVEVKLISLENDDVITGSSGESTSGAKKNNGMFGDSFDFGDMNTQIFS